MTMKKLLLLLAAALSCACQVDAQESSKKLQDAEKSCRAQIEQLTKNKAPEAQLAKALHELAGILVEEGRPAEAEPLYNQYRDNDALIRKNIFIDIALEAQNSAARETHEKAFGIAPDLSKVMSDNGSKMDPNSVQYAQFLDDVAIAYPYFKNKTQPVIPIIVQAMQIRQKLEGNDSPSVAQEKFLIAHRLAALGGDYVPPALEGYAIWKKLSDAKDARLKTPAVQASLVRLAYLLSGDERTRQKGVELANLALANFSALAPNGDLSVSPVNGREKYGLGLLFENLGDYAKAEATFAASQIWYANHNQPQDNRVRTLIARARVCRLEGDYDVAWSRAREAEDLCKKLWGPTYYQDNMLGMNCLEVLTSVARSKGDLAAAENYARQLCGKSNLRLSNSQVASHQLELAQVLSLSNNAAEAASVAQKAVTILSSIIQPNYTDQSELAKAHLLLAGLALSKQDYKLADTEYNQALKLHLKDTSSAGVLGLVADYNGIAFANSKLGAQAVANKNVLAACEKLDEFVKSGFPKLSFAGQCAFIKCVGDQINALLSYGSATESADKRFEYVMRWQGLLINAVRQHSNLERSGDPNTVAALRNIRQELSKLSAGGAGQQSDLIGIQTRTEIKEMLERKLALKNTATGEIDPTLTKTAREFASSLSSDEVVVDMLRYKDMLTNKSAYFVFAVSKSGGVKGFRLGDADDIDKVSTDWLHAMASNSGTARDVSITDDDEKPNSPNAANAPRVDCTELANAVGKKLWLPIKAAIPASAPKVWICPDSKLATLPWSVLIDNNEGGRIRTCQIDSPRALLQLRAPYKAPQAKDLFVIGGIEFAQKALFLPGTESEANEIAALAEPMKLHVSKLTGLQPTKDEVLKHLSSSTYAHLATHGFFDPADDRDKTVPLVTLPGDTVRFSGKDQGGIDTRAAAASRNPLVLSGLLVAPIPDAQKLGGGQFKSNYLNIIAGSNNDRLTAEELVGQDLSHCNLVVLSACNTGRGKDYEGQGVMGLRAALIGAGTRGVLMSLWSVDDKATKELMKAFYQNLWNPTKPMKPVDALKAAQESVKSTPGGKWKHPYYWAGWVYDGVGW